MRWQIVAVLITLLIAVSILFISILRTASTTPSFTLPPPLSKSQIKDIEEGQIDIEGLITYELVNPGSVLPDHPLWWVKALRDRVWLMITPGSTRKAELNLLFADKRLAAAIKLFEKGNFESGYSTLEKGEHYLAIASDLEVINRQEGYDTTEFLMRLANASLKHRYEIESLLLIAPEDARPFIVQTQDNSKKVFKDSSNLLKSQGLTPPINPYEGGI